MSLGFTYFEQEAESILSDVAEFEPVGARAERKTATAPKASAETPFMPSSFALAVGMMAHDFAGQVKEIMANVPLGLAKPEQVLKKLRDQFDRSAGEMLKHSPGNLPSYEELKNARDKSPEALVELVANRAREHLTDFAVNVIPMGSKALVAALLKFGLDPKSKDSRGLTPLAVAQHRPEILQMLIQGARP